ncbi:hypothetical protein QMZ05_20815 [Bradyrhizobium sp. INPA03-11B]|uniref:hypothetical protein n=1 Tax=Bradyrhizobium sp. INPA03-11B TaxID=418598 RepID=UPI00338E226A
MTGSPPHKKPKHNSPDRPSDQEEALHFEIDAALISYFEKEANKGDLADDYVRRMANSLRRFSAWLRKAERPPMAGRLNHLDTDVHAHTNELGLYAQEVLSFERALARLRDVVAGAPVERRTAKPGDHLKARCAEDERLISSFRGAPSPLQPNTVSDYAGVLRNFSDWLQEQNQKPMAGRLHDDTLTQHANDYKAYDPKITAALRRLRGACREHAEPTAGAGAEHHVVTVPDARPAYGSRDDAQAPPTADVPGPLPPDRLGERSSVYGAWAAPSASPGAAGSPEALALSEQDYELVRPFLENMAAREGAPQHGALRVFPPSGGRLDGAFPPRDQAAGPSSSARAAEPSSSFGRDLRAEDFGYILGSCWQPGREPVPDVLIGELRRSGKLPVQFQPSDVSIHGRPYTAQLAAGIRERTPYNPQGINIDLVPGPNAFGMAPHGLAEGRIDGSSGVVEGTSSPAGAAQPYATSGDLKSLPDHDSGLNFDRLRDEPQYPSRAAEISSSAAPSSQQSAPQDGASDELPPFGIEPASPWNGGGTEPASPLIPWDQIPPSSSIEAGESSMPYDSRGARGGDDQEAGPSSVARAVGVSSVIDGSGLQDFGRFVGRAWDHRQWGNGGQEVSKELMDLLDGWGQLPTLRRRWRTEFLINGERYTAELNIRSSNPNWLLSSDQSCVVYLIHHPRRG